MEIIDFYRQAENNLVLPVPILQLRLQDTAEISCMLPIGHSCFIILPTEYLTGSV